MMRKAILPAIAICCVFSICALSTGASRGFKITTIEDLNHRSGRLGVYKALVIGIDDYANPEIANLKTAVNDANTIAMVLKEKYGFNVQLLLDRQATKEAIYTKLRSLAVSAGPDDSVLIYFAGHGEIDRTYNGGWWVPSDAVGGSPLTYLANYEVQIAMRSMKARHVLLISDSCYSGTLFGESRELPPIIDDKYYLGLYNEKSRWGMTSGNKEPVSDVGSGGHSVFAYQLLKILKQNAKPFVSIQEIYTRIAPIISNNSEQTPICRPIRNTGDQGGEFVFVAAVKEKFTHHDTKPQKVNMEMDLAFWQSIQNSDNPALYEAYIQKFPNGTFLPIAETKIAFLKKVKPSDATAYEDTEPKPQSKVKKARLFVVTEPDKARVRILNIQPNFQQGLELNPGSYHVEVTADGYQAKGKWVSVREGEDKNVVIRLEPVVAKTRPDETWREPVTGMEFVWVPGGCFQMGSPASETGRGADEGPVHEVCVGGFWMGKYEVTNAQYRRYQSGHDSKDYEGHSLNGNSQPAVYVSWKDSKAYTSWLTQQNQGRYKFRLPSEAEWEYAARNGTRRARSWGNDPDDACRYANVHDQTSKRINLFDWQNHNCEDGYAVTAPVGRYRPNAFGLYDMLGNIWEWCADIYAGDAYGKHKRHNPIQDYGGSLRVIRGGGWRDGPRYARCALRDRAHPDGRGRSVGFRLLRME